MNQPPAGTITFLFTDIEGSTKLWQHYPEAMPGALARHHVLLKESITSKSGYIFQIIGDAFCAAFSTADDALEAAIDAQQSLTEEKWGDTGAILVRMALHTGRAQLQPGEFTSGEYQSGLTLSRAARLLSAGHGGQILLSLPTAELVRDHLPRGITLRDLGARRLKDLIRPEQIFQVIIPELPSDFPPLKTLDVYPHNLPVQLTSFIGREREIGEVKKLLAGAHLLTLTGAGGVGKTRLALQLAADRIDEFPDGVWFVNFGPISNPSFVEQAIAEALSIHQEGGRPLMDLLADYVRRRELLLVLDNCEHLVEACAQVANQLLQAASKLKILATSREALGVAGEQTYLVPQLSIPDVHHLPLPESLSQYEAVRLFIDRSLAVRNDFEVNNINAPAVAQICHRLDGIPLAIELAAARVSFLSPDQISARLDDRFHLLTGGIRTAIPRHQTLRAVMDWSWDLLTENERTLLGWLSVFAGGWTLEAAEAVCQGKDIAESEVLDLLSHLVSKSLVTFQDQPDEPRYHLLETIRQYTSEKLVESGDEGTLRLRHAEFFTKWAELANSQMASPLQEAWVKRLEIEQDNLRSAMEWAIKGQPITVLRIANALAEWYWYLRSAYVEAVQWYERALPFTLNAPASIRAYALAYAAHNSLLIGRTTEFAEESLRLARLCDDKTLLVYALGVAGTVKLESGDLRGAAEWFEEALPLAKHTSMESWVLSKVASMRVSSGDYDQAESYFQQAVDAARASYDQLGRTEGLWNLGHLAFIRGDLVKARADLTEGLDISHATQNRLYMAHISETLGRIDIYDSQLDRARAHLNQALLLLQDLGMRACLSHNLDSWARLAMAQGAPARTARLLGAIKTYLNGLGMTMIPLQKVLYDQTLTAVKEKLAADDFRVEWEIGEKLNLEQAIKLATEE